METRGPLLRNLRRVVDAAHGEPSTSRPPTTLGDPLPWDFEARARVLAKHATRILDLTTGDGALLGRILRETDRAGPPLVVAADRRARHLVAARARLEGQALLLRASPADLPFPERAFDLVLLRHRPFDPRQIAALVGPGGVVLTEQIHARNWHELRRYFPRSSPPADDLELNKKVFRRAGFELIDVRTHERPLAFSNLEHVVHALTVAPWIVPQFSPERDADALLALQADLEDERGIVITRSRYVLEVHRPRPLD